MGWWTIWYASLVVNIPLVVYPHLNRSFWSESLIFLRLSSWSISSYVSSCQLACQVFSGFHKWKLWGDYCCQNLCTWIFSFCCMVAFHLGLLKREASLGSCCQDSSQNLAVVPEWISQKLCVWMKALCILAAFQISEPGVVGLQRISSSFYFLGHTWPAKDDPREYVV